MCHQIRGVGGTQHTRHVPKAPVFQLEDRMIMRVVSDPAAMARKNSSDPLVQRFISLQAKIGSRQVSGASRQASGDANKQNNDYGATLINENGEQKGE